MSETMIAPVPPVSIYNAISETDELEITSTTRHNSLPLGTNGSQSDVRISCSAFRGWFVI